MYAYLYDAFVRDRRYESLVNRIEARIAELGLQGKVERLTILKNAREIVDDAVKKGADTFVIVGDDTSVTKILNSLAGTKVTLGLIPVGPKQTISSTLGIPYGEAACDTLSRRIIRKLDLGKANAQYFLVSLDIPKPNVVLESDRGFSISALGPNDHLSVLNFPVGANEANAVGASPDDGFLEAVVAPAAPRSVFGLGRTAQRPSVFPVRKLKITCKEESLSLVADGENVVKTPVAVEVRPQALRVIVGRDRKF